MTHMVEGARALNVENDVVSVMVKGEENSPTFA